MSDQSRIVVRLRRTSALFFFGLAAFTLLAALGLFWVVTKNPSSSREPIAYLFPIFFFVMGCGLAWFALRRWSDDSARLTMTATGIEVPHIASVPIRWADVRGARMVRHDWGKAGIRHYIYFDLASPDSYCIKERTVAQRMFGGLPQNAPPVAIDLTDLDHDALAILGAVRRFQPAAVVA